MKTKVLLLIQHLTNGGAERMLTLWAQMLCDAGYAVTVATYYPLPNEYPLDPRVTRVNLIPSFEQYSQLQRKNAICKKNLEQYLTTHPQDLLIPFLPTNTLLGAFCDQTNIKIFAPTIRNSPWNKERFYLILQDWVIQKHSLVILQNHEQAEYFNTSDFKHVKKYIIHNPLNPAIEKIAKTNYQPIKKIVAVGRLVPQKNHALMIEAMRILRDEFHENYQLDIYGAGELQNQLQAQIDQAELGNQVKLCGRINEIFPTMVNYDLFFLTSLHEGTPNALLEAMGLGLPSLAIKCRTGITELIDDGKNGYIIEDYDAHALATKIRAINNPKQLAKIGKQARNDMMTRYAPAKIQAELVAAIQDLINNPPHFSRVSIKTALKKCGLPQTAAECQSYFEDSLRIIQIANRADAKKVFTYARRALKNAEVTASSPRKSMYRECLRKNRFHALYQYLQKTLA